MSNADDALAAAAEAEAAEAEALAAAARARAQAIRLRSEAAALEEASVEEPASATPPTDTESSGTELDEATLDEATPADAAVITPRRRPSRALLLRVAAVTVPTIASVVLLGLGSKMYVDHESEESSRRESAEFAAAARQGVVTLMSLDFNKAKEDAQRIIDNTTGDFKKDFERQAKEFVQVAQDSKVVTEANVNAVAVQSMTNNTATVLVAVATNVSNKASSQQAPRSWRLSVDVARDGGQIKMSKVEFVQ